MFRRNVEAQLNLIDAAALAVHTHLESLSKVGAERFMAREMLSNCCWLPLPEGEGKRFSIRIVADCMKHFLLVFAGATSRAQVICGCVRHIRGLDKTQNRGN
jgi:hypothetical protein